MKGYFGHIEEDTTNNTYYRKVLWTGKHSQLVLMTLKPGEEIGLETHEGHDQFFRFEEGEGLAVIDGEEFRVEDGDAVIVPSGSEHNVTNTGDVLLKLYTIYSPAEHPDGTLQELKP